MTDTGQVPGEGLPENAGMVEQPGVQAPGAYTYLDPSETPAEDDDLLLMPGAQGAWSEAPGPHETAGRDTGSVELGGAHTPAPHPGPARRPLHLGPPLPDTAASPVRSLADRGPARPSAPPAGSPEYLDAAGTPPWGTAETVVPDPTQEPQAGPVPPRTPDAVAQQAVAAVAEGSLARGEGVARFAQAEGFVPGTDGGTPAQGGGSLASAEGAVQFVPRADGGPVALSADGMPMAQGTDGVSVAQGGDGAQAVGGVRPSQVEGAAQLPQAAGGAQPGQVVGGALPFPGEGAVQGPQVDGSRLSVPERAPAGGTRIPQTAEGGTPAQLDGAVQLPHGAPGPGLSPVAGGAQFSSADGASQLAVGADGVPLAQAADGARSAQAGESSAQPSQADLAAGGAGSAGAAQGARPVQVEGAAQLPDAADGTHFAQAGDGSPLPQGDGAQLSPVAGGVRLTQAADGTSLPPTASGIQVPQAGEGASLARPVDGASLVQAAAGVQVPQAADGSRTQPTTEVAQLSPGVDGTEPVQAVDEAPLPHAADGAPLAQAADGTPAPQAADGSQPQQVADGAPLAPGVFGAELAHAADGAPLKAAPGAPLPNGTDGAEPAQATDGTHLALAADGARLAHPDATPPANAADGAQHPHGAEAASHGADAAQPPHGTDATPPPHATDAAHLAHAADASAHAAADASDDARSPRAADGGQLHPAPADAHHPGAGDGLPQLAEASVHPHPVVSAHQPVAAGVAHSSDGAEQSYAAAQPEFDAAPPHAAPRSGASVPTSLEAQPMGQFVPVEGSVPTTPHLAPTPPHALTLPQEGDATAPAEPQNPAEPAQASTPAPQSETARTEGTHPAATATPDAAPTAVPADQRADAIADPGDVAANPGDVPAEAVAADATNAPDAAPDATQNPEPVPAVSVPAPRDGDNPAPGPAAEVGAEDAEPLLAQDAESLDTQEADDEDAAEVLVTAQDGAVESIGTPAPGYAEAEREAVLRVMRERRDIRNGFRSDPIPHEVLLRVLEAAHTAPSVGHSQPWDFVVIRSAETRRTMHELAMRQRDAYAKSLPKGRAKQFKELKIEAILDTPVNIVVTADPTRGGRHTLGRHTQPQMAPYSSALAVENLWLAARAEGLGVGWVSFFDEREMVRSLGLPEHLEVVAYLCVGYVDEFPDEPELMQAGWSKRRPLSWVVHEETYGRRALPGEEPHDLLAETVAGIRPLDAKALGEAWERQKRMTKPAGALGMLEIISAQLCGLSRMCPPPIPEPAAVAIFAGDHGVHAQGVTPWPQEVTGQMVANFLGGGAVCNAFANQVGAEVCVIDVGVASDLPSTPGLLPRKVRAGTADMTTGPALTREEVKAAIEVGIETARDLVAAGNKALLTGEMGIANTTASAALISVFTDTDPSEVTGRGTGINDETLARKTEVVRRALELHQPDPADPIGVLAAIGGLEHAAMVGLLLGGASLRTPVILDGVSAGAAALVARAIAPEVLAACIAGHRSAEPGHVAALNKLGLRPLVDLDLRLGEGTGALLALPIVQSAARAMHEVATFDSAGVTEK